MLRQPPLPADEIARVEEGTAGQARHALAALDPPQGLHLGLEGEQAGRRLAGRTALQQGQRLRWQATLPSAPPVCRRREEIHRVFRRTLSRPCAEQ